MLAFPHSIRAKMDLHCAASLTLSNRCQSNVPGGQLFVFMALLESLLRQQPDISDAHRQPLFAAQADRAYDFIVIGAGSAGCVVASRLSENADFRVLLVEAGGPQPIGLQVPAFQGMYYESAVDWNYPAEPNGKSFLGQRGQHATYPRGKMLGGSSALNGMMYLRGNPADYDRWQRLGNDDWSYERVLGTFRKSEDNAQLHDDDDEGISAEFHGIDGDLPVERTFEPRVAHAIMRSIGELGYERVADLNGATPAGFAYIQANTRKGVRGSSARSFLGKAYDRPNLDVLPFTRCTRIVLDESGTSAVAVELVGEHDRSAKTLVRAEREVIVSAGSFESPKLLQLSGIGGSEDLSRINVDQLIDLPGVGRNLQNHAAAKILYELDMPNKMYVNRAMADEYLQFRTGPLSTLGLNLHGKIAGSCANGPDDPDLQIIFFTDLMLPDLLCSNTGNSSDVRSSIKVVALPTFLQTKSRGFVRARTSDPFDMPEIQPNMLSCDEDGDRLLEVIRILHTVMMDSTVMRDFGAKLVPSIGAPCARLELASEAYWRCVMAYDTHHVHHPVGTCRMGPGDDADAVVDAQLIVHGLRNVRVADASIMPLIVSANTHATAVLIGEKVAAYLLDAWQ